MHHVIGRLRLYARGDLLSILVASGVSKHDSVILAKTASHFGEKGALEAERDDALVHMILAVEDENGGVA